MRILLPGTGRVALALLAVVPAVMAFPWQSQSDRWTLAMAAAVVLVLFAWWRGLHVTTIVRRRVAISLRRGPRVCRERGAHHLMDHADADARTTVVLRVLDGVDRDVPLDLVRGYLDRYGVRCESVRITSRDTPAGRTTWIGMNLSAAANLAALQARSSTIPLRETAEVGLRRLADQLREQGWAVTISDLAIPDLLGPEATEHWRAVADAKGYLAAYSLTAHGQTTGSLPDVLRELRTGDWDELWTAIEMSRAGLAASCAIRTPGMPGAAPPLAGLTLRRGTQWDALHAMIPTSTKPLDAETLPVDGRPSSEGPSAVRWPADGCSVG